MALLILGIEGDEELQEKLTLLAEVLDVDSVADEGAALLLARIRARFLDEVDPEGRPWVPSFAARIRAARGRGGGTLFDTGRLFHSLQVFTNGPGNRTLGTDVPYAAKHNFGLGQVKRTFLGINDDDVAVVTQSIIHRVNKAMKKSK
jgi:phage gpG-like protein